MNRAANPPRIWSHDMKIVLGQLEPRQALDVVEVGAEFGVSRFEATADGVCHGIHIWSIWDPRRRVRMPAGQR